VGKVFRLDLGVDDVVWIAHLGLGREAQAFDTLTA
jgi:hypothetical protein